MGASTLNYSVCMCIYIYISVDFFFFFFYWIIIITACGVLYSTTFTSGSLILLLLRGVKKYLMGGAVFMFIVRRECSLLLYDTKVITRRERLECNFQFSNNFSLSTIYYNFELRKIDDFFDLFLKFAIDNNFSFLWRIHNILLLSIHAP